MLYYGFYIRRAYSWDNTTLTTSNGISNAWDMAFTTYAIDANATNGVFTMGINTTFDTTTAFTSTASLLNDNIYTTAVTLSGLTGNDLVYGSTNAQQLLGSGGNNTINGGGGADTLNGGTGINMVSFGVVGTGTSGGKIDPYGVGVNVNLIAGTYNYATTYSATGACVFAAAKGVVLNFRQVWGSDGADTIVANNLGDTIWGNEKADSIVGGNGGDLIFGDGNAAASTDGNDTIRGGTGNNTIFGGLGNDLITTGNGNNFIYGDYAAVPGAASLLHDGDDSITAGTGTGTGNNTIYGGGGADTITADNGNNEVFGDYAAATVQDAADRITVGNGRNTVAGGGGNDIIAAGTGSNLIFGDFGAPSTIVSATVGANGADGADTITAGLTGSGNNTIYGGGAGDSIAAGNGNNLIFGDYGTQLGTTLTGGDFTHALNPGDGNDTVQAGNGNNTIYGGGGSDSILAGNGADLIFGDNYYAVGTDLSPDTANASLAGADTIIAGSGADTIFGGAGNDVIDGGAGNDVLLGGIGDDTLYSGSAAPFNLLTGTVGDRVYVGGGATGYSIATPDPLSGSNTVYAGYDLGMVAANGADSALPQSLWGSVILEDFNPNEGDQLFVAPYTAAIIGAQPTTIGSAQGANTVLTWTNPDSLNLTGVQDNGLVVVSTGPGDDTIDAGAGNYDIYNDGGFKTVNLEPGTTANVYLTTLNSEALINGFTADDHLYINKALVNAFGPFRQTLSSTTTNATGGTNAAGQAPSGGLLGGLTYGAVNNAYLGKAPSLILDPTYRYQAAIPGTSNAQPYAGFSIAPGGQNISSPVPGNYTTWTSQGAMPNSAYDYAAGAGQVADYASGAAELYLGDGLLFNPFTFIIGAALVTIGGLTINDAVNNIRAFQNPTYSTGASITGSYADVITGGAAYGTNDQWNQANILSLFNTAYGGGTTPALEITAADLHSTVANTNGLNAIVAVNTTTSSGAPKTYVYLVTSPDNLITNAEAKLLAEVDYTVTASQIVMYDASQDPFDPVGPQTPILPPAITSVVLNSGAALGNAIPGGYVTANANPSLTVSLDTVTHAPSAANPVTVQLYRGADLIATQTNVTQSTVTFASIPGFTTGDDAYSVVDSSSQGFMNQWTGTLEYDANTLPLAGTLTEGTEADTLSGRPLNTLLEVASNEKGGAGFAADPSSVDVSFGDDAPFDDFLTNFASYAPTIGGAISTAVFVEDTDGLQQAITSFTGAHGTIANPTLRIGPASTTAETITGAASDIAIYGFGLYDNIIAGTNTDFVIADDTSFATASITTTTGLTVGSNATLLVNGTTSYQIVSYNSATGAMVVSAAVAGSAGNASLSPTSLALVNKTYDAHGTATATTTSLATTPLVFAGGVTGADSITASATHQILYAGGGADTLTSSAAGGDTLVGGGAHQLLQAVGGANTIYDALTGGDTLAPGSGADTIDASHGHDTIAVMRFADATPAAPPIVTGFNTADDVIDIAPALAAASNITAQSFVGSLAAFSVVGGASLAADSYGYGTSGGTTYVLFNTGASALTGITAANLSGLSTVIEMPGTITLTAGNFHT